MARPQDCDMANPGDRLHIVNEPGIAGQQRSILLAGIARANPVLGCVDLGNRGNP
jgi:hypothetical protein